MEVIFKGSFGQVVKAFDKVRQEYVAIKIIKSKLPFYQQALYEIGILQQMKLKDPQEKVAIGEKYFPQL
jgi:dual specificity tyrosine-phosphorylation-regulated kinase 1